MSNISCWGIGNYVEIFGKVIKRFLKLLLIFVLLLNAFMLSVQMIMPKVSFLFPIGILKALVMMTGEVTFDELFYDKNQVPNAFEVMTQVIYNVFVVIGSIMLINLLIGFTVSDVKKLSQSALVNQLVAKKLQHLYFLETLLFDLTHKCSPSFYRKFQLVSPNNQRSASLTVFLNTIPPKLQQALRKLAVKNTDQFDDLKIPATEGVIWVKAKNGFLPDGAVRCDYLDDNEDLHVTRVTHGKNVKVKEELASCLLPVGRQGTQDQ